MRYVIVFVTAPNKREARRIGKALLEKRLIACVNIIDGMDSFFWWMGKRERARECLMLAKTRKALLKRVIGAAKKIHPYKVPEIIAVPVTEGHGPYLRWIKEVTS